MCTHNSGPWCRGVPQIPGAHTHTHTIRAPGDSALLKSRVCVCAHAHHTLVHTMLATTFSWTTRCMTCTTSHLTSTTTSTHLPPPAPPFSQDELTLLDDHDCTHKGVQQIFYHAHMVEGLCVCPCLSLSFISLTPPFPCRQSQSGLGHPERSVASDDD